MTIIGQARKDHEKVRASRDRSRPPSSFGQLFDTRYLIPGTFYYYFIRKPSDNVACSVSNQKHDENHASASFLHIHVILTVTESISVHTIFSKLEFRIYASIQDKTSRELHQGSPDTDNAGLQPTPQVPAQRYGAYTSSAVQPGCANCSTHNLVSKIFDTQDIPVRVPAPL